MWRKRGWSWWKERSTTGWGRSSTRCQSRSGYIDDQWDSTGHLPIIHAFSLLRQFFHVPVFHFYLLLNGVCIHLLLLACSVQECVNSVARTLALSSLAVCCCSGLSFLFSSLIVLCMWLLLLLYWTSSSAVGHADADTGFVEGPPSSTGFAVTTENFDISRTWSTFSGTWKIDDREAANCCDIVERNRPSDVDGGTESLKSTVLTSGFDDIRPSSIRKPDCRDVLYTN